LAHPIQKIANPSRFSNPMIPDWEFHNPRSRDPAGIMGFRQEHGIYQHNMGKSENYNSVYSIVDYRPTMKNSKNIHAK